MKKTSQEGGTPSGPVFDRGCLAACVLFACIAALNIVFLFHAHKTLIMPLTEVSVSSLALVIAGIAVTGLSGIMSVFSPHRKPWFICQVLLTLADAVLIASFFFTEAS